MAKLRVVLALLVVLWGAPALGQPDYEEPGEAGAESGAASAQQDQGAAGGGAAQDGGAGDEGAAGQDDAAGEDAGAGQDAGEAPVDEEADIEEEEADVEEAQNEGEAAEEDAAAGDEDAAAEGQVAGGGAAGEQPWTFSAFDADGNGAISEEEFDSAFYNFVAGGTAAEGLESDNYLSVVETFGLNMEQHALVRADADGDSRINSEELSRASASIFDRWDRDSDTTLTDQEFANGMFMAFDTNEDQVITADELEDYADWFVAAELDFEEVAGGGAAEGGFGQDFFLTGDQSPVQPQVEEEEAAEEDAADPMQGQPADGAPGAEQERDPDPEEVDSAEEDAPPGEGGEAGGVGDSDADAMDGQDEDPADDDAAEDAPPGEGGDAGEADEPGDQ